MLAQPYVLRNFFLDVMFKFSEVSKHPSSVRLHWGSVVAYADNRQLSVLPNQVKLIIVFTEKNLCGDKNFALLK